MEQNFLATYRDGNDYTFSWFMTENEVQDWIDNESNQYTEVNVVELTVTRVLV